MAYTPPPAVPAEVTEVLQRMKDAMPMDLGYSKYGSNILKVFASELSSLEEAMREWFVGQFVATATGDNLKRWEALCGIAPEPTGIDEENRRDILTAHLAGRFNYSGKDFIINVARLAYGTKPAVSIDNVTGTATLTFAVGLNSFEVDRIVKYCQASGPAHYQWEVDSDDASSGFVVNAGLVGFTKI
jgi:hypothetical protein